MYKWILVFLLLIFSRTAEAQEYHRSIQVELPGQDNNKIKASMPGVGCWFWVEQELKPDGYKPFIDLYARHTNFRLLTTSMRNNRWVDDPAVYEKVKAAADYARENDMGIVFDLDVRHARNLFGISILMSSRNWYECGRQI